MKTALRDKRIFLMRGGKKGMSEGIYFPVRKPAKKNSVEEKILLNRQKLQTQMPTDGDKFEVPTLAFENLKVMSKSIKDKI